jgi:hypothetical protein
MCTNIQYFNTTISILPETRFTTVLPTTHSHDFRRQLSAKDRVASFQVPIIHQVIYPSSVSQILSRSCCMFAIANNYYSALTQLGEDELVVVEVGTERRKYHIHKTLLEYHSGYFRGALHWPYEGSVRFPIPVTDAEPGIFKIFVEWLYSGRLPEVDNWPDVTRIGPGGTEDMILLQLAKACVLGDSILTSSFRMAVNNLAVDYVVEDPCGPWYVTATYAFQNLPEKSPFLRFLLDLHCRSGRSRDDNNEAKRAKEELPLEFFIRVMDRYGEKTCEVYDGAGSIDWWWHLTPRPCRYHEHNSTEERKECRKK